MADRTRQNLMFAHQEWLGFVQPVGLVVAPAVMVDAQVLPDRNLSGRRRDFRALLEEVEGVATTWRTQDLRTLFTEFLGWQGSDFVNASEHRDTLELALPELHVVLSATWAVPTPDGSDANWMMLIREEEPGSDFDKPPDGEDGWNASRHARFERLLRETGIPIGLLCNAKCVRLIYAPKGESSGYLTFDFSQMAQPAGGPILAAFDMLLSAETLFTGAEEASLPALLARSREAQAEVSNKLSRQVLGALYELLRGFVAADARTGESRIQDLARERPDSLYGGLITALMRLVFVLYTEDRGLMPDHPVYQQHYSLGGLFSRLRRDKAAWPDTMDQRFGAWAQLLALFRLIYGGGSHAGLTFVARKGALFDPDRFPFLEGRTEGREEDAPLPMVPDSTVWKVLESLMVLDGERLSYRTLDVEQIGSVYEAIMGFRVELTTGRSIAVRSQSRTGAAVIMDLDRLLGLEGSKRAKALQDATGQKLPGAAAVGVRDAMEPADVVAGLDRKVDRDATPDIMPPGTPILQPTDERRRSGSHYTPRSLTEPIVAETLRPIFERLGPRADPEQILDLKVLDPATGSGAFLVEACRQLAARLVEAWSIHGGPPEIPADEDELLNARRLVAQRCLYGVDRNPMAIDLARMSLWLATFAKDHEFTFIDHTLKHGDSLVGLTRQQIEGLDWEAGASGYQEQIGAERIREQIAKASELNRLIREAGNDSPRDELQELVDEAREETAGARLLGDLTLAAFFKGETKKKRKELLKQLREALHCEEPERFLEGIAEGTDGKSPPITPFHWSIEFPEVFDCENPGFDAIVGNPPFLGGKRISTTLGDRYRDWLGTIHRGSNSNADIVAHFFRRAFDLVRYEGTFGLIATNTIAQGDTRATGLRWLCEHEGEVYNARRRVKWPGLAAVVVSVVHVHKGELEGERCLDNRATERITAFLFHRGSDDDPAPLNTNAGNSFVGSHVLGMGFTFDDFDKKGVATPVAEMQRLIAEEPHNQEVIFPFIGGEEVNTSPNHAPHRYAIDFRDFPLRREELGKEWKDAQETERRAWKRMGIVPPDYPEAVAMDWPDLAAIVETKAKPERDTQKRKAIRERWWQYADKRPGLYSAIRGLNQVLVVSRVGQHAAFAHIPSSFVYADSLVVFPFSSYAAFCALQSRPHEIWARFFASSLEDRLRYTPSDCFETCPFPEAWETRLDFEAAGRAYYEFRATLMIENSEGLTKTYNRFHDPDEQSPEIGRLRALHATMDRSVLGAYGWTDLSTECEFILDHEADEETGSRRKKPWRYRWADAVHDEVLSRLIALNAERADEERLLGHNRRRAPDDGEPDHTTTG